MSSFQLKISHFWVVLSPPLCLERAHSEDLSLFCWDLNCKLKTPHPPFNQDVHRPLRHKMCEFGGLGPPRLPYLAPACAKPIKSKLLVSVRARMHCRAAFWGAVATLLPLLLLPSATWQLSSVYVCKVPKQMRKVFLSPFSCILKLAE